MRIQMSFNELVKGDTVIVQVQCVYDECHESYVNAYI